MHIISHSKDDQSMFSVVNTECCCIPARTFTLSVSLNRILRQRGHFGNVSLTWQLFHNDSALQPGNEFWETYGTVYFMDGEGSKPIVLHAVSDKIPEFNEFYILKLVNVSGIVFHITISFLSGRK